MVFPMRHFPVFLELHGRTALVLGDGDAARRKAALLARAGAQVRTAARFSPSLLQDCAIAIGAEAPEADLQALSDAAFAAGIPVNIVDRPKLCSFFSPAIVDRDPLTVAVSTSGAAPVLARVVRARIEALLPPTLGRVAALLDDLKHELRARLPDFSARRRAIESLLAGPAAELALAGRAEEARDAALRELLGAATPPSGMLFVVGAGPGPADLLTLRAQRLLSEADVIVHEPAICRAVLDMARRDAHFFPAASPEDAAMRALAVARAGRKVVLLRPGNPVRATQAEQLDGSGVPYEVVPGVP
jgi:uroporphyrin-III C-methyltransferase/precorrin-2 dehydrogenase/sirohydrochlorin ferrochelatase